MTSENCFALGIRPCSGPISGNCLTSHRFSPPHPWNWGWSQQIKRRDQSWPHTWFFQFCRGTACSPIALLAHQWLGLEPLAWHRDMTHRALSSAHPNPIITPQPLPALPNGAGFSFQIGSSASCELENFFWAPAPGLAAGGLEELLFARGSSLLASPCYAIC